LLFLPLHSETPLKAVLSYYSATVTLNSEGDTQISDETLEGLGRNPDFLTALFGAIIQIAQPPKPKQPRPGILDRPTGISTQDIQDTMTTESGDMYGNHHAHFIEGTKNVDEASASPIEAANDSLYQELTNIRKNLMLTDVLPDPGYFTCGAIAGVVSRTSTAPLDRLKVYLMANISSADISDAAKKGNAVIVARKFGQPLIDATKDLWKAGGLRSLFAGKFNV
jgi:solute carrier family 25 phosphate transporter 23/24/25/41